jgi:hypothetical protein
MSRDSLTTVLALMVASVWTIVTIASLITSEYGALTAVSPVMLIVVGFIFAVKGVKITTNGNGNGKSNGDGS